MFDLSSPASAADRRAPRTARGRLCVLVAVFALLGPGVSIGHAQTAPPQDDVAVDCTTDAPPEGCGASVESAEAPGATTDAGASDAGASDPGTPDAGTSDPGAPGAGAAEAGPGTTTGSASGGSDPGASEGAASSAQLAPEPGQTASAQAEPTTLVLTPRETVPYAADHAPSASLSSQGQAVVGAAVRFALGDGTSSGTTDDAGSVTAREAFTIAAPVGSELAVHAVYDGEEGQYLPAEDRQVLRVVLGECTLRNQTPAGQPSGSLQLVASFDNVHGTSELAGRVVVFSVEQPSDEGPRTYPAVTGEDGVARTEAEVGAGAFTVSADFAGDEQFAPCSSGSVVVGEPSPVGAVALTPVRSAAVVGSTQQLTATVTDAEGRPVEGVLVTVRAVAGPSAGAAAGAPVTTDARGVAVLSVTSAQLGTDVLVASVQRAALLLGDALEGPGPLAVSDEVTLSWVYAPTGSVLAATPADAATLARSLAGPGVTISNVTATGHPSAFGTFTGGQGVVGFGGGIVMSSGEVQQTGPGDSFPSVEFGTGGDPVLDDLVGAGMTRDAAVLSFDFVPTSDQVLFQYVFGSSEYSVFVNDEFNDVFVFQVNGKNCATVPGTGALVRINNINAGGPSEGAALVGPRASPHLFLDNDADDDAPERLLRTSLGGVTTVLTCRADVLAGQVNRMRLAIADVSDSSLDSVVFLQADSLVSVGRAVEVTPESGTSDTGTTATVLAGVFDDGSPVPGVLVTVVVAGVGETLTSTLTTGPAGTVPFAWSRSAVGTDTVVATTPGLGGQAFVSAAVESADGVLSSTPRTWTWVQAPVPPVDPPVDPPVVTPPVVTPPVVTPPVDPPPVVTPPVDPPPVVTPPVVAPPVVPPPVPGPDPAPGPVVPTLPPGAGVGPTTVPVDPLTGREVTRPTTPLTAALVSGTASGDTAADEQGTAPQDEPGPPEVLPFVEPEPAAEQGQGQDEPTGDVVLDLALDRPSTLPGGVAQVSGSGCVAGQQVVLSVGGERVAGTTAGDDGRFAATLDLPRLDLGVHDVEARCGDLVQTVPLTLVVGSAVGGVGAAASTVGVVLAFFVLLATMFLLNGPGAPSPTALAAAAQAAREDEHDDDEQA